ncbi:unnamed protein product, partial [Ectocarpus fasciculatus]
LGGDGPPHEGIFGAFPSVEFDSFIAFGGRTAGSADVASPGVSGAAIKLDISNGSRAQSFSTSLIDIGYFIPGALLGTATDRTDYFIARITLSENATGRLRLLGAANGGKVSEIYE